MKIDQILKIMKTEKEDQEINNKASNTKNKEIITETMEIKIEINTDNIRIEIIIITKDTIEIEDIIKAISRTIKTLIKRTSIIEVDISNTTEIIKIITGTTMEEWIKEGTKIILMEEIKDNKDEVDIIVIIMIS